MFRLIVRSGAPILLITIAIFVFGILSYVTLPREAAPDVKVPFVMVTTPYPGVSPSDIESLVSIPIENELAGLKNLKVMRSTSAEGVSIVFLEFEPEVIIEDALQRVRDRVNRARPKLPDDVEESRVRELSFTDIPVLIVTVAGPHDETVLKRLVEDLEDEVARIPGVLEAEVSGGTERELKVLLDPARLDRYGATLGDVVNALQAENVNIPGGDIKVGDANVLVRVPAEIRTADDIAETPVKTEGGYAVRVRDLGRIEDGLAERSTYARMNGAPAVSLRVKKRTGANIVSVADDVKALVKVHAERWPEGTEHRVLADQSKDIRSMVQELQNNIFTALVLVVAVILFFMGLRNSLFVALAIPLSMFASFSVLQALGFTLNMVVLFSLILALGMLVDNGIVVVENVYRHLELGKGRWRAAIDGTREMALPVAASTATTVAAFFPLVFWGGIMGQFMGYLPKTVIIVLTASLVVAVLILPVFTSRLMARRSRSADAPDDETPEQALARMESAEAAAFANPGRVMGWYKRLLAASIRWRYASIGIGFATLVLTFVAYGFLNHGVEFFPATEPDRVIVNVRGPDGTDLDTTDAIVRRIERQLREFDDIDVFVSEVGVSSGSGGALVGSSSSPQSARITVDFLAHPSAAKGGDIPRSRSSDETMLEIRGALAVVTGAEITVEPQEMGPPVGAAIEVKVAGTDFRVVGEIAQRLRRDLARIEGVTDLRDDYRVNRPELALRIDRVAAKQSGLSTGLIGNTIRMAVNGATATTLRDGEKEYDVVVRLAPEFTADVQEVLGLKLPGRRDRDPAVYPVPLSAVAGYELAGGTGSVARTDQRLTVTITGDVLEGVPVDQKQKEVQALLDSLELPPGYSASLGGSSKEQEEAMAFLSWAMLIAISLIALVLVAQFNDFVQPLIILVTVVLSLIGVLWGLLITGTPFGVMMTGIGVISLAGVVVNNAIVLLDYVRQLLREGHSVEESLMRAGMTRFRPVMLTAATTVLGLVPMAVGVAVELDLWWVGGVVPVPTLGIVIGSQSSAFWGPMAVAVIFGLSFATVLTLVMVPTMYSIYDDVRSLWRKPASAAASVAAKVALGGVVAWALLAPFEARAVSLEEAWAAARANNPDLQIVGESSRQARTQRLQAWSLVQPRVSAQGNYSYFSYGDVKLDFSDFLSGIPFPIEAPEPTIVQRGSNFDGNVTVSQPLFNGMALPLLAGAYKNADAAQLDERRTDQQVRAGVARAYYGLAAAREAVGLSEKAVRTAQSQLALAQRQVAAGLATRRAELQGQLGVAQAERDLRRAQEQLVGAQEAFVTVTGLRGDVALDDTPPFGVPGSLDDALRRGESARPDLTAALLREQVAGLQVRAEGLAWMPDVNARWSGIANQTPGFAGRTTFWTAGVTATWTLWDGGMRLATIRQAASQERQSRYAADKVRRQIDEDVRVAWEVYGRAEAAVRAVEGEVALAADSLDLARRGFEAGTATFLEVEQAELALRGAELNRLTERTALALAAVDLLLATGEL